MKININYFNVSNYPWIASVSRLLQISCVKSRISSCFVLVQICMISFATLSLLKEMMKNKLPMMSVNCRNFYLVTLEVVLRSPLFKLLIKVTLLTRSTASMTQRCPVWILSLCSRVYRIRFIKEKEKTLCAKYTV